MMKKMKIKGIAGILSAVLIIAGAFLIGTPGSKVLASENIPNIDKFLSVKWQVTETLSDGTKNMRIVTTIDADEDEKYGNVGFEITFLADENGAEVPMHHRVKSVFHRIAAKEGGIKYEYGPKVFHSTSEWFATCTIEGIPSNYWDNGIVIKPYVTIKGDTSHRYYGEPRYLTMNDIANGIITLPVEGQLTNPTVSDVESDKVDSEYYDGYTYMRVKVDNLSELPSISQYTVKHEGGEKTVKYRYLLSSKASDTSWYNLEDEENVAVIVTASEMVTFQKMSTDSKYNGFAGKTIYLGADIDLNPDWDAITNTGTATTWDPIGESGVTANYLKYPAFAGVFDGNMHTIKGVYISKYGTAYSLGLFGEVNGATIKNFTLSNSRFYIASKPDTTFDKIYVGSVVGILNGRLENVKTDEKVHIQIVNAYEYNGGMVGVSTGTSTITNCCFAGQLLGSGLRVGGISGGVQTGGQLTTVENCLVTGEVKGKGRIGGLIGTVWNGQSLQLENSLFAGNISITTDGNANQVGTVIGQAHTGGSTSVNNVYAVSNETFTKLIGADSISIPSQMKSLGEDQLKGSQAYLNMDVDFCIKGVLEEEVWTAIDNDFPQLTKFVKDKTQAIDLTQATGSRTLWYKPTNGPDTYTLYTAADLRGFQEKSTTDNFASGGVQDTVKLGADIYLNPTTWEAELTPQEASNKWTPIGDFAGIFDGDMHTLNGIYLQVNQGNTAIFSKVSGTVQKLIVENSYIENTGQGASTGSIVGELSGNLDTVKSSAYVVLNNSEYAGGLVGKISGTTGGKITNCWFAGRVSGAGGHHGTLLGGITSSNSKGYIEHCLSTGIIDYNSKRGGLVGSLWSDTSYLEITDCLFAGKFEGSIASPNNLSNTYAQVNKGSIKIQDVYIMRETGVSTDLGGKTNNGTAVTNNLTRVKAEKLYLGAARENTTLSICEKTDYGKSEVVGVTKFWYISDKYPILASFGEPVEDYELKVATYNIRYGRHLGEDEAKEQKVLQGVAEYISTSGFDVVLLQEVNGERTINKLDLPGYEVKYQETDTSVRWGTVGVAIVSKYNIVDTQFDPISKTDGNEDRGIYKVMLDVNKDNKADVAVICTHFDDKSETDSATGVTLLREMISTIYSKTPNMPIVFGGDLNQAYNGDHATQHIQDIAELLTSTTYGLTNIKTYYDDSFVDGLQLDYIFTNNYVGQGTVEVQNPTMDNGDSLSDHRPLVATIYIKAQ